MMRITLYPTGAPPIEYKDCDIEPDCAELAFTGTNCMGSMLVRSVRVTTNVEYVAETRCDPDVAAPVYLRILPGQRFDMTGIQ